MWQMAACAVCLTETVRCTNKTATHTESGGAYRPLRGCLTAGEVALAGQISLRLHTHTLYVSFYYLLTEMPKVILFDLSW